MSSSSVSASAAPRPMWVWSWTDNAALVSFAQSHGINRLLVWTWPGFSTNNPTKYRDLIQRAYSAGIATDALSGDTSWVTKASQAESWAREVVAFGAFAGMHLDVEPYALSSWKKKQAQTITSYLSMLSRVKAAAGSVRLEEDIPFWFDTISNSQSGTLDAAVMDRVDAVTVMTYRDYAEGTDSIIENGRTEIAHGAARGKQVRLAVETNADLDKVTFYEEGAAFMAGEMSKVDAAYATSPVYAGIAIHDYKGFAVLAP